MHVGSGCEAMQQCAPRRKASHPNLRVVAQHMLICICTCIPDVLASLEGGSVGPAAGRGQQLLRSGLTHGRHHGGHGHQDHIRRHTETPRTPRLHRASPHRCVRTVSALVRVFLQAGRSMLFACIVWVRWSLRPWDVVLAEVEACA